MSGGNSSKNKARSSKRQEGWEEAGGEFYQESYPGGNTDQDLLENLQRTDATKLATLLPSKQVRSTTVKRVRSQNERRQSTYARTAQSHDVHLSMLPDLSENLSNEERTWEEIMLIKAMPVPMSQKRDLKAQLQNATKLRLQGLEQLQWRQRIVWHQFSARCGEVISKLELWQHSMKKIEGNFGTGVVAYFLFLRWLLFLNLAISAFIVVFLILPKVFLVETTQSCDETQMNSTACCHDAYVAKGTTDVGFLDIIQGTGRIERTILFYGVYSNQIYDFTVANKVQMFYNFPLAYILVPIAWFLFSLFAIVKSATKGFKDRLVESEGQFYKYCNLVFGGWDFCIHNEKSSKIKHKALYNEIKCCIEEEKWKEKCESRTRNEAICLHFKRVFINIIVLGILIGAGVLIYVVFNYSMEQINDIAQTNPYNNETTLHEFKDNKISNATEARMESTTGSLEITNYMYRDEDDWYSWSRLENLLLEFLPSICIVCLNLTVPEVFAYLITFENYTPAFNVNVSLLRTIFLRLSSLAVLMSQIYSRVTNPDSLNCSAETAHNAILECWETYVGQQLYKLILTDFFVQFVVTFFINMPRSFIARHTDSKCLKIVGEQEFNLPKHVLDVVYAQTIIWMGAFFCPFLPIIGTIFYLFIFYIKKFACLINCTPSPTVYRASKSKSMFMFILLLSFVVSILPVAYTVAELQPSRNCGPYRGLDSVWDLVVATFDTLPEFFRNAVFFLGTSGFAVPLFALVILMLYYYWAVASANRHMVTVLKSQLVLEGHDKQFLLNRLSAFIRQHQKRCERARNRASFVDDDSIRQSSK